MIEHDYKPPDDLGRKWCRWCGTLFHAQMTATCLERPDAGGPAPRPWRGSALDDNDALSDRLAELRREREAAIAAPAEAGPVTLADEMDWLCG